MSIDIQRFTADELDSEKLDVLISQPQPFQVVGVGDISATVSKNEGRIEKIGLRCRVYTEYWATAMAGSLFSGVASVVGQASAVGIAAHRLATINPDYEIGKNKLAGTITVKHVK
ncbi:hypothetical protein GNZ10_21630 [Ralstonia sp. 3N]|jgi:hypothetical protein|uniref:hypothetical protein n=1 Tax=Ralstonia TaxID=48736 RepID=UPI00087729CC|nr:MULTISPECIES: hypothetical protein [Ralstonia]MBA9860085.1 hypothetical protein [Ralstonia insidiosa]MBA9940842.1 hypothetical protein [Ralstonia insidiosa]MBX3905234.1 hypothetical protein [Ralstonia insidiosa]NPT52286.1 hypothetical protein [Ralstonia sp. 3N]SCW98191.1 hypothetical protein SAMN02799637_04708 [Ralstonia sp. UNCCL144]